MMVAWNLRDARSPEGGDAGVDGALGGAGNGVGEQRATVPVDLGSCRSRRGRAGEGQGWVRPERDGDVVLGAVVRLRVARPRYRAADPEAGRADGGIVDCAHAALRPDADLVVLVGEVVAAVVVEGLEVARASREVLCAVGGSSVPGGLRVLRDLDAPRGDVDGGQPGHGQRVARVHRLQVHVVAAVLPAKNRGWI